MSRIFSTVVWSAVFVALPSLWYLSQTNRENGHHQLLLDKSGVVSKTISVYQELSGNGGRRNDDSKVTTGLAGIIRYHYYTTSIQPDPCSHVLLIGVGTMMTVADYDKISKAIVSGRSIVVAFTDHSVNNIMKTSPKKYATLWNETVRQLHALIPICAQKKPKILFGGHSASGQAAIQAWQQNLLGNAGSAVSPVGFLGLDPYEISGKTVNESMGFHLPSLNWGFHCNTCLVDMEMAARAAYEITRPDARILYSLRNGGNGDKEESRLTHCVFTDHGCGIWPFTCGTQTSLEWVLDAVAISVQLFLEAIDSKTPFDRTHFLLPKRVQDKVNMFINDEIPVLSKNNVRQG